MPKLRPCLACTEGPVARPLTTHSQPELLHTLDLVLLKSSTDEVELVTLRHLLLQNKDPKGEQQSQWLPSAVVVVFGPLPAR